MMTQKNRKLNNKTILFRRKRLRTDGKENICLKNMMVRDGINNQDEEREREREE